MLCYVILWKHCQLIITTLTSEKKGTHRLRDRQVLYRFPMHCSCVQAIFLFGGRFFSVNSSVADFFQSMFYLYYERQWSEIIQRTLLG